jgi:hypothetical protein
LSALSAATDAERGEKRREVSTRVAIAHGIDFSSDEFDSIFQCSAKRFPIPERPH